MKNRMSGQQAIMILYYYYYPPQVPQDPTPLDTFFEKLSDSLNYFITSPECNFITLLDAKYTVKSNPGTTYLSLFKASHAEAFSTLVGV
ncbi:MAG: hypothetical protein JWO03_550 [Bacteroidetes bacterium]|nr:hypothetical protein [Bacteroidota bacterium]